MRRLSKAPASKYNTVHNPLAILQIALLDSLVQAGHTYFVLASYPRGMRPGVKESLLVSHYRTGYEASEHYAAIATDKRRRIYDMNNPADKEKLYHAATQPEGYAVYAALLRDKKWKPGPLLAAAIKRFMRANGVGRESLSADLFIRFGELFITLKKDYHIPLSEIEKI